jgi:catechol 2,3-dioxygenase-like lactoylglutathione lyase family enzyme
LAVPHDGTFLKSCYRDNSPKKWEKAMHRWYARPVLFVSDVDRALHFYVDMLGFTKAWHEGDGQGKVCQVGRSDCEIILCEDAGRTDKGRLFVELTREGIAQFRGEILERSVRNKESWWGYDVIQIDDPDGNELLFPLPDSDGEASRAS